MKVVLLGTAEMFLGMVGTVIGITDDDACEGTLDPRTLVAVTVKM
jgi:hypothetical protein